MAIRHLSRRSVFSSILVGSALVGAPQAQACEAEPYLGSVCMTAATYCPRGYAEANGQLLSISQYSPLFAVMGTTYGGDGRTNFALPDLRGRSAVGQGQGPGLSPVPQGAQRGAEQVKLSAANLPTHNHAFNVVNENGTSAATAGSWLANPVFGSRETLTVTNGYVAAGTPVPLNSDVVGVSGASTPVTNLSPQLGMRYCVATEGLFPPRD